MFRSLKSFMLCSSLLMGFFTIAHFNQAEAAYGRWGAYDNERGAWGGNGGWWGESRADWYGDNEPYHNYYGGNYSTPYYSDYSEGYNNNYYYDNSYPYGQHYYDHPGIGAGAGVDGAGVYFNVR